MPFSPELTPTKTTIIPALSALVLCAGLVLIMSETAAPAEHPPGDRPSSPSTADGRVQREARLTEEMAVDCATKLFTQYAKDPHTSKVPTVAGRPTIEEIGLARAGVLEAIGELDMPAVAACAAPAAAGALREWGHGAPR